MTIDIDELKTNGVVQLPPLEAAKVEALHEHLASLKLFRGHVAAQAKEPPAENYFDAVQLGWQAFAPLMEEVVLAPHWFEYATSFYDAAKDYLGPGAKLYSLNAFWTCPSSAQYDTQGWHRDTDDDKQFTIFGFGSDVTTEADGPHAYQMGTHHGLPGHDHEMAWHTASPPESVVRYIYGPAGTSFIEDTWILHRSLLVKSKPRLLLWARYGLLNPPRTSANDRVVPIPAGWMGERYARLSPELKEAVSLVVRPYR